jgi:hypothetical protein
MAAPEIKTAISTTDSNRFLSMLYPKDAISVRISLEAKRFT